MHVSSHSGGQGVDRNVKPTFPNPDTLVSATRCQQVPGRCPRHAFDFILVTFQHSQTLQDKSRTLDGPQKKGQAHSEIRMNLTSKSSFVFFQMHVVASKLAEARYFPQGDQATFLTVRWCPS